MANKRNGTLYTGVTSNLPQRIWQHKNDATEGFTKKYQIHKLVYYEQCPSVEAAIFREKQIKGGSRKKKIILIEKNNPQWNDLSDNL